jgi:DNA repair protein RecN (Recombination protein N)
VHRLTGDDRVQEIARMLAGDEGEQQSLEHARALLNRYRRADSGQNQ